MALDPYERWKRNDVRAKMAVALGKGALKREPCFVCGELETEGHHADYCEPLNVVWLCAKHHCEVHGRRHMVYPWL